MQIRNFSYFIGQAFTGIWRNGFMSLAAITTVAICLTVLAAVLLLAVNLQFMAAFVEDQVEVVAYFDEELDRAWHASVLDRVRAIEGVAGVTYVSREQALQRLKEQFGEQSYLLEGLDDPETNPLRDSLEISPRSADIAHDVAARVAAVNGIADVTHRQDVVDRLLSITGLIRSIGLALVALLSVATIFVIANTIRLTVFARRDEIAVMKLVGATDGFIRWPFLIEGCLIGLFGAALASVAAWVGYEQLAGNLSRSLPFLPILPGTPLLYNLGQLLLVSGVVIGAIGSSLSVRRFLRI